MDSEENGFSHSGVLSKELHDDKRGETVKSRSRFYIRRVLLDERSRYIFIPSRKRTEGLVMSSTPMETLLRSPPEIPLSIEPPTTVLAARSRLNSWIMLVTSSLLFSLGASTLISTVNSNVSIHNAVR